jgi:imidazolonepropionase-like amidohydrolase
MTSVRNFVVTILLAVVSVAPIAAQTVAPTVLIKNATVIDGTGKPPQRNVSILLESGKISAIGANVTAPPKAQVIDATGKYVIPGLIDTRVQLNSSPANRILRAELGAEQRTAWMHSMLGAGITLARFVQGDLTEHKFFQHWRELELLNGPNVVAAGPTFTADNGSPAEQYGPIAGALRRRELMEVANLDQARDKSRTVAHGGADVFEIVYDTGPDMAPAPRLADDALETIVKEAHGHELKVFCSVGHNQEALKAIAAGVDVIESISEEAITDEVAAAMVKHNVAFIPSLVAQGDILNLLDPAALKTYLDEPIVKQGLSPVMQKSLASEKGAIAQIRAAIEQPMPTTVPGKEEKKPDATPVRKTAENKREESNGGGQKEEKKDETNQSPSIRTMLEQQEKHARENVSRAKAAGVHIVLGTGAGTTLTFPGASAHREMQLFTKAGLTPMEAILAATSYAAASLGKLEETGTLERGKRADLVILDADPLADIANTTKINTVVRGGRVIHPGELETY